MSAKDVTEVTYKLNVSQWSNLLNIIVSSTGPGGKLRDDVLERMNAIGRKLGDSAPTLVELTVSRMELGAIKLGLLSIWSKNEATGSDRATVREVSRALRIWDKQVSPLLSKGETEETVPAVMELDDESDELDPAPVVEKLDPAPVMETLKVEIPSGND